MVGLPKSIASMLELSDIKELDLINEKQCELINDLHKQFNDFIIGVLFKHGFDLPNATEKDIDRVQFVSVYGNEETNVCLDGNPIAVFTKTNFTTNQFFDSAQIRGEFKVKEL